MSDVKRYEWCYDEYEQEGIWERENGDLVKYEDVVAMETERDSAVKDRDELRAALRGMVDAYKQDCDEVIHAEKRACALLLRLGDLEQTADGLRWRAGT